MLLILLWNELNYLVEIFYKVFIVDCMLGVHNEGFDTIFKIRFG
jgi:hypothetical protein